MKKKQPCISLLISTYNRSHLIERAVESVLNQTFQDFEIVLVDNGSQDDTKAVIQKYDTHPKVRTFYLEKNRGARGGFNFAFDQISGEWFTVLGDDDTLIETAFETMIAVPSQIDPTINAVTCNCIDSSTQGFSGYGLDADQYLTLETIIQKTSGEFYGITKTELLGDLRLNEKLVGHDDAFWYNIDAKAKRYYIHKALRVFNTGDGTISSENKLPDVSNRIQLYEELYKESFYFEALEKYDKQKFIQKCLKGLLFMKIANNEEGITTYKNWLTKTLSKTKDIAIYRFINTSNPWLLQKIYIFLGKYKKT